MLLKDKVVIITGGGNGLGKEGCLLFAKEGAIVIVADYNELAATEVAKEILESGGKALGIKVDVGIRKEIDEAVEKVINEYGRVDILINNAGIINDSTLLKMTEDQWNSVININQTGVFHFTQAVAPYMVSQGYGKIINTSSIVGRMGNFGQTNYAATKAALIGMTQTWAKELGRKGIRVNAVAPGFIKTEMTEQMPEKVLESMKEKVSLKQLGTPRDVANVYLFLSSEASDYINGSVICVDGGLSI